MSVRTVGPPRIARGNGPTARLTRTEVRLRTRDPLTLVFVAAFPVITMLIIGGSFGSSPDDAFEGQNPSHWYVASYLTVVIGAVGLITLPVHIASYRERGVLRRFAVAGFPRWSFAVSQFCVGLLTVAVGAALLLLVAWPVYGVPAVEDPARVVAGAVAGATAFVALGVLLGTLLDSARSAQAVGLLLFFPSFLLGVGGPPPDVLGAGLRRVAAVLPLAVVTDAIRLPWLGLGTGTTQLVATVCLAVTALVVAARRTAL